MPESEIDTSPPTLKPNPNTPVPADISTLSPKDAVRQREDEYNAYLAGLRTAGKDFKVDTKTGVVQVKSGPDPSFVAEAEKRFPGDAFRQKQFLDSLGDTSEYETDTLGSGYLANLTSAELAAKRAQEDAAEAKKLQGSVRSFMDVEADKTAEITRQFKDFDNRASLLYDLMDAEQQYGMNADDQNIQNMKAQRDLGTAGIPGGYYTKPYMSGSLSSILAPSLPDYVRPDYRLNGAVGLPGPQGFDDPNYDSNGLPMYAMGTQPKREIIWPWRTE